MVKTINKDSKEFAIEFAEWLINGISNSFYEKTFHTLYTSKEISLTMNRFIDNFDLLFNKFLEEKYNGEIQDI